MRKGLAAVLLILVVAVAWRVMAAGRRREAPPAESAIAVEVRPVESTTLIERVVAGGSVMGISEVTVTSKLMGRVAVVLVREGDRVRAGQPLVRLETAEIEAQVRQADANLAAARARLRMLEEGARPQERAQVEDQVRGAQANLAAAESRLQMLERGARPQERAQTEAAVAQAKANYETARANADRMRSLHDTGAVSKAQLEAADLQRDVAKAQYDTALQQLSLVQTGARPEEIDMARSQVRAARAQLDAARQQRSLIDQGPRAQEIQMAAAQVAQIDAALAFARLQLSNATATAPLSGTVTRRFVDPGQLVMPVPGQNMLVTVANLDTVHVWLDVSETDLARVQPGQPVFLHLDAYPNKAFAGTVREVGFAADPRARAFRVKVSVPNPSHLLKPGMFARGEITTGTHEQALVIPRDAIVSVAGQSSVFVIDGGRARVRTIRLGMTSGPMVEVISGLARGDSIVVAGQGGLSEGTPVTVR